MKKYIMKRFVNMALTFIGVVVFMMFIYLSLPGNYVSTQFGMSSQERKQMEHRLHLDQPKIVQFKYWITGVLKGDFGRSYASGEPVLKIAAPYFKNTFVLFSLALFCALIIAIPVSVKSAARPYSKQDWLWTIISIISVSVPAFVLGAVLNKLFTFNLFVFRLSIWQKYSFSDYTILMRHYILPFVIVTFANIGIFVRYLRSNMLEIVNQDYIRTARAKGVSERVIYYKHCLKNAIPPVLTVFGNYFPSMISSLLMVELVLDFPGFASVLMASVGQRDYPLVMAFTMMLAIIILISNFIIDILYYYFDPRIQLTK